MKKLIVSGLRFGAWHHSSELRHPAASEHGTLDCVTEERTQAIKKPTGMGVPIEAWITAVFMLGDYHRSSLLR